MSIEKDLFEKLQPDRQKLLDFGFENHDGILQYSCKLCGDEMNALITYESGEFRGRVFDAFDEEYIAFRIDGTRGEFASKVRGEYLSVLEKIGRQCCEKTEFASLQANRIAARIKDEFQIRPEYVFDRYPEYAVFRTGTKWFGLIMMIENGQIKGLDSRREVLNVKIHPQQLDSLLCTDGIYPAFHMNRKHWVSVDLNDTLNDETVMNMIRESMVLAGGRNAVNRMSREWIIPANPAYFDIDHAFAQSDLIYWKQSSKVQPQDLVYIYYGKPYGEIRYLCRVIETDLPFKGVNDGPVHFEKLMRIRKIRFFENHLLSREAISKFGVTNVRGPRYMPAELKKEIERLYHTEVEDE